AVRDLRRPARLLRALGQPGRPAGARRHRHRDPRTGPPLRRRLHGPADRRAPPGRRRGPRPRPHLPPRHRHEPFPRPGGGPRRAHRRRVGARPGRPPGTARPRPAGRGRPPGGQRPRTAQAAARRIRGGRTGGRRRDRRRRTRRTSRPAQARQDASAARGGRHSARKGVIRTVESEAYASPPVLAAYRYCEAVTGHQARNFAYGIRLLPTPKRRAMSALYAFSRRVDDIGDGALDREVKAARLEDTRQLLTRIREGAVDEDDTDPVAVALAHAADRFPIPLGGLDELIDGVQMDVRGATYETWDDLKVYCRCVAGAIGRLSLGVFGTEPGAPAAERAPEYDDTLGLALQLTNILRDVREDAVGGRTYLPADDLAKFGCSAGFA